MNSNIHSTKNKMVFPNEQPVIDQIPFSRRELLSKTGLGLGSIALAGILNSTGQLSSPLEAATGSVSPMAVKKPHFKPKAKHVIHIFLNGGSSHLDTFDHKPILKKFAGKELPTGNLKTERKTGAAFPSPYSFKKYGESGIEVSEIFPEIGKNIDDITVIRSMHADVPNHEPSLNLMNCGHSIAVRPSFGSWTTYGLGTENQNLPGFIVMCPNGYPIAAGKNWKSAFLPGVYQGTHIDPRHKDIEKLIENIHNHSQTKEQQRKQLDLLQVLNRKHQEKRAQEEILEAKIHSFELAYNMQMEATDAFDISKEPKHVLEMYGDSVQARQILIARRLVERGVRFIQLWHGAGQPWDHHDNIEKGHRTLAGQCDKAIGALIQDLKQRGLLDETLIQIGGEFGRTPSVELPKVGSNAGKINGRDHNHWGFTTLLCGGGVKGGYVHGSTDEFGFRAVDKRVHVHDLHATMLKLLGFDHEKLTYHYSGQDFRFTDIHGHVVEDIIA